MSDPATRVLLVEDDPAYAYLLRRLLTARDGQRFVLVHVDRLSAGLERLEAGGVDVLLLDLDLSDSFGIDTFHTVHRGHPRCRWWS